MTTPFGAAYSGSYDAIYGEKDYAAECSLIEELLRTHARGPVSSILDLGCGTGNHAIPLTQRGYAVTGVDRSEAMLALARAKAERAGVTPIFGTADVRHVQLGREFDAALMMFAVLGYQIANADLLATLRAVRAHLAEGSLFIFDVWHGPAVVRIGPSPRIKVIETGDETILRAADGTLNSAQQTCLVTYQLWRLRGSQLVDRSEESHVMRYFFLPELRLFLQVAGFELVDVRTLEGAAAPTEDDWNMVCVARAIRA